MPSIGGYTALPYIEEQTPPGEGPVRHFSAPTPHFFPHVKLLCRIKPTLPQKILARSSNDEPGGGAISSCQISFEVVFHVNASVYDRALDSLRILGGSLILDGKGIL